MTIIITAADDKEVETATSHMKDYISEYCQYINLLQIEATMNSSLLPQWYEVISGNQSHKQMLTRYWREINVTYDAHLALDS